MTKEVQRLVFIVIAVTLCRVDLQKSYERHIISYLGHFLRRGVCV